MLGGHEYHIGDLVTTSDVTSSLWGDDHLFFRHQWTEDDVALRPEWTKYYPAYSDAVKDSFMSMTEGVISKCPFANLWQ